MPFLTTKNYFSTEVYLEGLFIPLTFMKAKASKTSIPNQQKTNYTAIFLHKNFQKKLQNDKYTHFLWSSSRSKG